MSLEPGVVDAIASEAPQHARSRALLDAARAVEGWMDLLRRRPVTGADVFDLQLTATMPANGVSRIYTFNDTDFAAFSELAVTIP